MGLSSSKSKTTNKPVYSKEIEGAAGSLKSTYDQQAPKIAGYADQIGGLLPSLLDEYKQGNPAVNAAQGYITDTLSGDPAQNPYLDQMVDITNSNVRNQTQAAMGTRGQTGGSDYAGLIAERLARNEGGMRYNDYDQSMNRRAQAAGMAPGVAAGRMMTLAPAFGAAELASGLPMNAASQFAAGTGGLLGQYQNTTQKKSPSIMEGLGQAAQIASMFSDERLKENITRVGETYGGLGVFTYNYKGDVTPQMGVMAQEVEVAQPDAIGPEIGGFKTVQYGKVR